VCLTFTQKRMLTAHNVETHVIPNKFLR
jgi:hypothetical protein